MSLLLLLSLLSFAQEAPAPDAPPPAATQMGQTLQSDRILDHDFGFALSLPQGWLAIGQERARGLVADAVAGALSGESRSGFVLVNESIGTLEENTQLALGDQPGMAREILSQKRGEISGVPAILTESRVNNAGMLLRQLHAGLIWDQHYYQIVCTGAPDLELERCEAFVAGFSLLKTRVRARAQLDVADVATRSWRVRDGVFESAVTGITLRSPPGWRLVVGEELRSLSPDADVGLARTTPEAWALLVAERAGEGELEMLSRVAQEGLLQSAGQGAQTEPATLRLGAREVEGLKVESATSPPFTWWHGLAEEGGLYLHAYLYTASTNAPALEEELRTVLQGYALLDEPARAALERELATSPVPAELGLDWSLRYGRWTGYSHGLAWSPPEGIWDVTGGDHAANQYAGSVLYLTHPRSGVGAALLPLGEQGRGRRAHAAAVSTFSLSFTEPERGRLAGRRAFTSTASSSGQIPMIWRLSTFQVPDRGTYALLSYALSSNQAGAQGVMIAAEQGFEDARTLRARRLEEGFFESHRLGVRLALPDQLPCEDPIEDFLRPQADGISCIHQDKAVMLMAIKNSSVGVGDSQVMQELISQLLGARLSRPKAQVSQRADTLAGLPSLRIQIRDNGVLTSAEIVNRDHILVMLLLVGMSPEEQDRWRAGLQFLD